MTTHTSIVSRRAGEGHDAQHGRHHRDVEIQVATDSELAQLCILLRPCEPLLGASHVDATLRANRALDRFPEKHLTAITASDPIILGDDFPTRDGAVPPDNLHPAEFDHGDPASMKFADAHVPSLSGGNPRSKTN